MLNADFHENLVHRTVKPSEPLLRLGNRAGPWDFELRIPQRHVARILAALDASPVDQGLTVEFVVQTSPSTVFRAKLTRDRIACEAEEDRTSSRPLEPTVTAFARVEDPAVDDGGAPGDWITGCRRRRPRPDSLWRSIPRLRALPRRLGIREGERRRFSFERMGRVMNRLVGSALLAMAMCGPGMFQPTGLAQDKRIAASAESGPGPSRTLSGAASSYCADPLVVPECRLVVAERQEAPSQREGVLLFVGTEIGPGEQVSGERMISIRSGEQERRYRRLREGDEVRAGQLLALVDDRLARDELAIKRERVAIAEAELFAAEQLRDEAKDRYLTQMKLRGGPGGPATSEEDVGSAKVVWYKNHYEAVEQERSPQPRSPGASPGRDRPGDV